MRKMFLVAVVAVMVLMTIRGASALGEGSIIPADASFSVNLAQESNLRFTVQYSLGSVLADPADSEWALMQGDVTLLRDGFIRERKGVYLFDHDFKDSVTGDYILVLTMDGRSEMVDVRVINVGSEFELFLGSDGEVAFWKVIGAGVFLLVFFGVGIIFLRAVRGRGRRARH